MSQGKDIFERTDEVDLAKKEINRDRLMLRKTLKYGFDYLYQEMRMK